jgi:hypothetical protein
MTPFTGTDLLVAFLGGLVLGLAPLVAPPIEDWLDRRRERRQTERLRKRGVWR